VSTFPGAPAGALYHPRKSHPQIPDLEKRGAPFAPRSAMRQSDPAAKKPRRGAGPDALAGFLWTWGGECGGYRARIWLGVRHDQARSGARAHRRVLAGHGLAVAGADNGEARGARQGAPLLAPKSSAT
jgi:hypothetical protein